MAPRAWLTYMVSRAFVIECLNHRINTSPPVLSVNDPVLERIAELGHVPVARRHSFFETVCASVKTACELHASVKQGRANKRGAPLWRAALGPLRSAG